MQDDAISLRAACADLNGQMRGKRMPASEFPKIEFTGLRMPLSALNVDLWGEDIVGSPLVFASGDGDGQLRITERGPVPMPWLDAPTDLVPMWMFTDDGRPFAGDPRHALGRIVQRFHSRGWKPIAATELEFTLVDPAATPLRPAARPPSGPGHEAAQVLSVEKLDAFAPFFDDVFAGAEAMGIKAQGAVSEAGAGQFELNLAHGPALRVADDTWLMKALVRGMAAKHGMAATFLAKPFADAPGNSMHTHVSVTDRQGHNLFDNGLHTGTALLHQAVAGCLACMPASTLVFAPWENSFARITPEAHAPTGAAWGYENRTTAIRIPGGDPAARRLEHRVAGADANPYLMLAAVLGAMLIGIDDALAPPAPTQGNAYEQRILKLPLDWDSAIARFAETPKIARIFPALLIDNLVRTKRQELRRMSDLSPEAQLRIALQAV